MKERRVKEDGRERRKEKKGREEACSNGQEENAWKKNGRQRLAHTSSCDQKRGKTKERKKEGKEEVRNAMHVWENNIFVCRVQL